MRTLSICAHRAEMGRIRSGRVTITISAIAPHCWKARTVRAIIGSPPSAAITLSMPPIREAEPAATITAPQRFSGSALRPSRVSLEMFMAYSSLTICLKRSPRSIKFLNWSKDALAGLISTMSPLPAAAAAARTAESKSPQSISSGAPGA